jgi:hypothetical protein
MSEIIIKKKRGRKPKNYNIIKQETQELTPEPINSEEENIILHLPITLDDINNVDVNNDISLFISSDKPKLELKKMKSSEESDTTETLKTSIIMTQTNYNLKQISTHNLNFNKSTKCWWCRNSFDSPSVQLPEEYFNETFYCMGHFCSYNCVKSYNLDLNDSFTSKRESLINLLYFLTYSEYKNINPAPNWMTLTEYGGSLSIEQFRENSIINTKEYLVLHPPLISRQMQIEESYKINKLKEVPIDKVNKIYSEIESEYSLKRSKPINSSHLNLESTMGLVKRKSKIPKF